MASRFGSRSVARIFAGALACVGVLAAPAARAEGPTPSAKATARALMDEGNERREHGDLRGALDAFRAADALVHVPTTALEVARVEAALGLLVEARERVEWIAASPAAPTEPRELSEARVAAAELSDELDARMPSLRVAIDGEGREVAALSIDAEAVPRAARSVAHRVDPGTHVVSARTPSGREVRVSITLREREARVAQITLPEATPPPRLAAPALAPLPPPPRPASGPDRTIAILGFSASGAGLAVGIISGVVALSHRESAAAQCVSGACPPSTFHDLDTAAAASTASDIGFAVAGAGAVIGLIDLLVAGGSSNHTTQAWIGPGGVHGRF